MQHSKYGYQRSECSQALQGPQIITAIGLYFHTVKWYSEPCSLPCLKAVTCILQHTPDYKMKPTIYIFNNTRVPLLCAEGYMNQNTVQNWRTLSKARLTVSKAYESRWHAESLFQALTATQKNLLFLALCLGRSLYHTTSWSFPSSAISPVWAVTFRPLRCDRQIQALFIWLLSCFTLRYGHYCCWKL